MQKLAAVTKASEDRISRLMLFRFEQLRWERMSTFRRAQACFFREEELFRYHEEVCLNKKAALQTSRNSLFLAYIAMLMKY